MFNVDLLLDKLFVFEVLLYLPTKSRTNKDIHLTFSYTLFTGKHRFRVERSKPAIVTHQLRSIILLTFVACTHKLYIYTLIILLKVNKILTLAGSHVTPSRAPMQIPFRLLHFIQRPLFRENAPQRNASRRIVVSKYCIRAPFAHCLAPANIVEREKKMYVVFGCVLDGTTRWWRCASNGNERPKTILPGCVCVMRRICGRYRRYIACLLMAAIVGGFWIVCTRCFAIKFCLWRYDFDFMCTLEANEVREVSVQSRS